MSALKVQGSALEKIVRDPQDASLLRFVELADSGDGVLVNAGRKIGYPVIGGVPNLLPDSFSPAFLQQHSTTISGTDALQGIALKSGQNSDWSFSREWDAHFETDTERTWGYTVQERIDQLFMETQLTPEQMKGMRILDAGCGNGTLTNRLGAYCKQIVGVDYSSGVQWAERQRTSENVVFLQGDLQHPPLPEESFDMAFTIGVLHHTDDTRRTFDAVAKLVKPGGKFYFWLYRKPDRFLGRYIKVPIYDAMRWVISRLPPKAQNLAVHAYARLVRLSHRLRGTGEPVPLQEYIVGAFDDLTCRWRYYHTPIEVARWLYEAGFSAPVLSHWDNPYGFGVVAQRNAQQHTPGIHYGDGVKLWDNEKTLLGRLHKD